MYGIDKRMDQCSPIFFIYISYVYINENTHTHTHTYTQYATKKEQKKKKSSLFLIENHITCQFVDGDDDGGATSLHVQNGNIHR
jgi:hypothetical protein